MTVLRASAASEFRQCATRVIKFVGPSDWNYSVESGFQTLSNCILVKNYSRFECIFTLAVVDVITGWCLNTNVTLIWQMGNLTRKPHSKRVEKIWKYTRHETFVTKSAMYIRIKSSCTWIVVKRTFKKLHSKRVGKMGNYTRNGLGRSETTLETGGELTDCWRDLNTTNFYPLK